ncbi:DMT family transporter [Xanthobacter autotrophicus]|uniref:DMT family transporter n=1 Tax=Xanthobacter autotrophicus TaxID=280 RepID=UPI00372B6BA3
MSLFSGFVLLSRLGLSTTLSLPDIAALRFGIGGLLLSPVLIRHGLSGLRPAQAAGLAVLGGLGFALFAYAGFALAPAAHGAILLHGTLALTTAVLLRVLGGQRIAPRRGLALAGITLGVATMAWDGVRQSSPALLAGDLCLLAASFCWSGYGLYVRRLGLPAVQAAAIVAGLSGLAFLPVYGWLPGTGLFRASWGDLVLQGVFQGVLIGVVSVFAYTRAVALLGAARMAMFTALVPGLATLGGYLLLGERPSSAALVGLVLTTTGMVTGLSWNNRATSPSN